jgi:hypothetical protein
LKIKAFGSVGLVTRGNHDVAPIKKFPGLISKCSTSKSASNQTIIVFVLLPTVMAEIICFSFNHDG